MTHLIDKTGDIFSTEARGIGHGVNVFGVMGSGIAVQFKNRFKEMHSEYVHMCWSKGLMPGSVFIWPVNEDHFVYNIASQDAPGKNGNYGWLLSGVDKALDHADLFEVGTIALPRIGAGVAGLEWSKVREVLALVASWHTTDIEVWSLPNAE